MTIKKAVMTGIIEVVDKNKKEIAAVLRQHGAKE
jgi:hypothetical protein